jgi:hypothetical protein
MRMTQTHKKYWFKLRRSGLPWPNTWQGYLSLIVSIGVQITLVVAILMAIPHQPVAIRVVAAMIVVGIVNLPVWWFFRHKSPKRH